MLVLVLMLVNWRWRTVYTVYVAACGVVRFCRAAATAKAAKNMA